MRSVQGVITERIFDSSELSAEILISASSVPYWQKKMEQNVYKEGNENDTDDDKRRNRR